MDLRPHIDQFHRRFGEVEAARSDPKVFENPARFQELGREYARLKDLVAVCDAYPKTVRSLEENRALLAAEAPDSEMAVMVKQDIVRLEADYQRLTQEVM